MKGKIHIEDFAELIGAELDFNYAHYQNKRIWVEFKLKKEFRTAYVVHRHLLSGSYGNSENLKPSLAVKDYCRKIAGKEISFDHGKTRIKVPEGIYYTERKTK